MFAFVAQLHFDQNCIKKMVMTETYSRQRGAGCYASLGLRGNGGRKQKPAALFPLKHGWRHLRATEKKI
jgi:hypothetical protein